MYDLVCIIYIISMLELVLHVAFTLVVLRYA